MSQLRFSGAHVWVRIDDDFAVLGLSDYLQDQMGDITTLVLPDLGDVLRAKRRMGHVESDDASSPLEAPVSGEPYGSGWLGKVRLEDRGELEDLISEEEYAELTTEV